MTRVFVTGSAGFIGFHLSELLLKQGFLVAGLDGMTNYYDTRLKQRRHQVLLQNENFTAHEALLEDAERLVRLVTDFAPDVIVHLAAQAGVRYSLENPRSYVDSNLVGTFNVLEAARAAQVGHLLMASTSSVYGANEAMPFCETDNTDAPLTIYAATKKANEAMGHAYAHLHELPVTMFRFFTVYGPWGRPDMVPFKFVQAMQEGRQIDIYNNGEMYRDFTYVTDLVRAIRLLIDVPPPKPDARDAPLPGDSLSAAAPFRTVNIGNSEMVRLLDFIDEIEHCMGYPAKRNYLPMQIGDVPATWADTTLLRRLTGYRPKTDFRTGIAAFVDWYRSFYGA